MGSSRFKEDMEGKKARDQVEDARPVEESESEMLHTHSSSSLPPNPSSSSLPPLEDPRGFPEAPSASPPPPRSPLYSPPPEDPEPVDQEPAADPPLVTVPPARFWLVSIGIYLALFISTASAFAPSTSLKAIADQYKSITSVTWVILAFLLTECCLGTFLSRASDINGRRCALVSCLFVFTAGSISAGFSPKLAHLVAARAIQGLGGSGLFSVSLATLQEVCPDHLVKHMAGLAVAVFSLGFILGPLLGGLLTQHASWKWSFWIFVPFSVISAVIILGFWPKEEQRARNRRTTWSTFDFIGAPLLTASIFLLVFGLQNAGVSIDPDTWSKPYFVAPITLGACFLPVALSWSYLLDHKMTHRFDHLVAALPAALLDNRVFASAVASALCLGFPLVTLVYFAPLRSELVAFKSPVLASLTLFPIFAAAVVGGLVAFYMNLRHHWLYPTSILGPCLVIASCRLLSTISGGSDEIMFLVYLAVAGLGAGMSLTSNCLTIGTQIAPENYIAAFGLLTQARLLGGCFGVAAFSVVLHNQILELLPPPLSPALLAALSDPDSSMPISLDYFMAVGMDAAFKAAMDSCTAAAALAMVAALFGCSLTFNTDQDLNFFRMRRLPLSLPERGSWRRALKEWFKGLRLRPSQQTESQPQMEEAV